MYEEQLMATRAIIEANDAMLVTLCAYDALWDGVLPPEVIDAEMYDTPALTTHVRLPVNLVLARIQPTIVQIGDRREAFNTLVAVVVERGGRYIYRHQDGELRHSLMSWELDWDSQFDHPIDERGGEGDDERALTLLGPSVGLSLGLKHLERDEAMDALLATVCEIAIPYLDAPFLEINIDGSFHDCQLKSEETFGFVHLFGPPSDFPR